MILYLHGFRSSPQSAKARMLAEHMRELDLADSLCCPQLPPAPAQAIAQLEAWIAAANAPLTLIGSSLGGYYATYLAEKYALRAVLVNPSVVSYLTLEPYLGTQTHLYTGDTFEFLPRHIDELRALEVGQITPAHYWLMVETGDEVLDYRQAVARYKGARQTILEGGDHSFTQWKEYLGQILRFADLL